MPQKIDKETAKILTEGDRWARFLKSEEWGMVKDKFMNRLIELSDLTTVDDNPDTLLYNIGIRKGVLNELYRILKEMEGAAAKGQWDNNAFKKERRDAIIARFDA